MAYAPGHQPYYVAQQLTEQMGFTAFPHEDVGNLVSQSNSDLYFFSSDYPHIEVPGIQLPDLNDHCGRWMRL